MTDTTAAAEKIAILDYGSQYTQLIARRIRERRVYSVILPFSVAAAEIARLQPKGVILSGGPDSVFAPGAPYIDPDVFRLGVPVLGVCYGMQLMAHALGGAVEPGDKREYGKTRIVLDAADGLFAGLPREFSVWMSHGDRVSKLPPGFSSDASSDGCPFTAAHDPARRFYAIQFHPEVSHTEHGGDIISNFLYAVCGCKGDWKLSSWIDSTVESLRAEIGGGEVVLGLSGGVDSSVAAVLLDRAIGRRLHCIFVDNGLLRAGEAEQVEKMFGERMSLDLRVARAGDRFFRELAGVADPETKRKTIGRVFTEVFAEEARKCGGCEFLAQGTIYPDVIESSAGAGASHTIKSHHNVGGLPPDLKFKLVEPLRELFKDEVRAVGRELGMDPAFLERQPFPGPGLGVRILGEVTREKADLLRQADLRVRQELAKLPPEKMPWQTFAVLLPVRTVGVMGDGRTYENVCAIRSVDSSDGMTADWSRLPYDTLAAMASRIANEVPGINRVVYDITSKPPATIEWE